MGVVYRAVQLNLDRAVALKIVAPGLAHDEIFRKRFKREACRAGSLNHPNIVRVYDAGEEPDGRLYLVMELINGTNLRARLRQEGRLEPPTASSIVTQLAEALDTAHAAGLVHRDVKPENTLLDSSGGGVYLTDFGLAKRTDGTQGLTETGTGLGTPDYAAPEQIRGERVDAKTDVYALACVLFEMLTGEPPYRRASRHATLQAHLADPVPQPSALRSDLPTAFDRIINRALAKRGPRYASAGDFARAVEAATRGRPLPSDDHSVARGEAATQPLSLKRYRSYRHHRERGDGGYATQPLRLKRYRPSMDWLHATGAVASVMGAAIAIVAFLPDGDREAGRTATHSTAPVTTLTAPVLRDAGPGTSTSPPSAFVPFHRAAYNIQRPADWTPRLKEQLIPGTTRVRSQWISRACGCDLVVDYIAGYGRTAMQNASEVPGGMIQVVKLHGFDDAALRLAKRGPRHFATYYIAHQDDNYAIRASAQSQRYALATARTVASSLSPRDE